LKRKEKYEKLQSIHDEANANQVDTPDFDKYLRAEAKGQSAIDNFQGLDFEK
jgi:hypothetical protein